MGTKQKKLGYREAMSRGEEIVRQLDRQDVEIDQLAPLVDEAAALLAQCRETLDVTTLKVNQTLSDLTRRSVDDDDEDDDEPLDDFDDDDDD